MQDLSVAAPGTVFQFAIAAAPRVEEDDLARHLLERASSLCLLTTPAVSPLDLSHRILRIEGDRKKNDRYLWEITFNGLDLPGEEGAERTLAGDVVDEVRAQLESMGIIVSSKKLVD